MNKKEQLSVVKAGIGAYSVSSLICYLKYGGIQLINQQGSFVIKIHKSLGVIDPLRLSGHLKDMDVFGADWIFFTVGMFSAGVAAITIKVINYFKEPETKKTGKGYNVKMNR